MQQCLAEVVAAIEAGDTEEDRRVFYVAVTRAKKTLTLTGYQQDRRGLCAPSRFLFLPPAKTGSLSTEDQPPILIISGKR